MQVYTNTQNLHVLVIQEILVEIIKATPVVGIPICAWVAVWEIHNVLFHPVFQTVRPPGRWLWSISQIVVSNLLQESNINCLPVWQQIYSLKYSCIDVRITLLQIIHNFFPPGRNRNSTIGDAQPTWQPNQEILVSIFLLFVFSIIEECIYVICSFAYYSVV